MYEPVVSQYANKMKELLERPKLSFSEASSEDVLGEPGVYVIYDERLEKIIYVGRTRNMRRRLLGDHRRGSIEGSQFRKALGNNLKLKPEAKITEYILKNCSFQFMVVKSSEEMIRLEHFSTAVLAPLLNVRLKQ